MFYIAICDDDEVFIRGIKVYLEQIINEINVTAKIFTFYDGESLLDDYGIKYDLILLDIELKNINGIETAQLIRKKDKDVIIIMISSFIQYAREGYSVNAYRYLLKPLVYSDLKDEIIKSFKVIDERNLKVMITYKNQTQLLKKGEILYIESFGHLITYHLVERSIETKDTMKVVEEKLNSLQFYKIHKSYIVNLQYIKSFDVKNIQLINDVIIPISRHRYKNFHNHNMHFWQNSINN